MNNCTSLFRMIVALNKYKTRKSVGFESLQVSYKEITEAIKKFQMSVSLSKFSAFYPIRLYIFKRWIYYRCLKRTFTKNIKASVTHVSCGICKFSEQLFL